MVVQMGKEVHESNNLLVCYYFFYHYLRLIIKTLVFFFIGIEEYEEQLRINSRYRDHGISGRFFEVDSGSYHHELMTDYWNAKGRQTLHNHLMRHQNNGIAKNVIFFLGDGMSVPTITAARIYLGQLNQQRGEEAELSFEKFPNIGLSKVSPISYKLKLQSMIDSIYLIISLRLTA